jgi:hypothetical protein
MAGTHGKYPSGWVFVTSIASIPAKTRWLTPAGGSPLTRSGATYSVAQMNSQLIRAGSLQSIPVVPTRRRRMQADGDGAMEPGRETSLAEPTSWRSTKIRGLPVRVSRSSTPRPGVPHCRFESAAVGRTYVTRAISRCRT